MNAWYALIAIAGLTAISVITRSFFLMPERELPIPPWLREALRHAPLAALVAVMVPELVLTDGHLIHTWRDPRLPAALVGALLYWRRRNLLLTIVGGTAVMLALHLGLGW